MYSSHDINQQLRACGARVSILSKGESRALPTIIREGETIKAFAYGSHPGGFGMMVATEQRLLVVNKTFFDTKVDEILYMSISGVEYDLGIRYGKVKLYTRAKDFELNYIQKRYLRPFVDYVNQQVAAQQFMPQPQATEPAPIQLNPAKPALTQLKSRLRQAATKPPLTWE